MMGIYVLWKKTQYVEFFSNVMHFEEQMQILYFKVRLNKALTS